MYIVRWLTGHPMIAVWVLGAIAILLSYGSTGKNKPSVEHEAAKSEEVSVLLDIKTDEPAADNNEQTEALTDSKDKSVEESAVVVPTATVATTSLTGGDSAEKDASVLNTTSTIVSKSIQTNDNDKTKVEAIKDGVLDDKSNEVTESKQNIKATIENTTKEEVATIKGSSDSTKSSAAEEAPDNKSSLNNSDTEVADLDQLSSDEMLKMAREAYWNNGLDEAAQIYQQLIKREPKVVEHRGELGNVYWRQGFPKKAAEIYSEIAIPMIENGNSNRVANMIGFIGLFYPDRASVINDRLQTHQVKKTEK